jgi:hypothetical protein
MKYIQGNLTLEKLLEIIPKLEEMYGENLPNPEHEPLQFDNIVKLYFYYDHESTEPTDIPAESD